MTTQKKERMRKERIGDYMAPYADKAGNKGNLKKGVQSKIKQDSFARAKKREKLDIRAEKTIQKSRRQTLDYFKKK